MDVIICNAVASLCLSYAVSCGECVVAAIFLRKRDRHLDGVAILVLLVRCSGTEWFAVVRVFLEYMDIDALKYARAPDPLWRSRGDGNGGRCVHSPCPPSTPYTRHCP